MTPEEEKALVDKITALTAANQVPPPKGWFVILMERITQSRSWRTALAALVSLLPQLTKLTMDWLTSIHASQQMVNDMSFALLAVGLLFAKDAKVTGANVNPTTGIQGPTDETLAIISAEATPGDLSKQVQGGKA